jgi:hypothetical protein
MRDLATQRHEWTVNVLPPDRGSGSGESTGRINEAHVVAVCTMCGAIRTRAIGFGSAEPVALGGRCPGTAPEPGTGDTT